MDELFSLTGRVALVTGAASGMGAQFAETLARYGASVICCARRTDRLDALAERIRGRGGAALAVSLDVTDRGAIAPAFDQAERTFGVVDILVNAAGITAPHAPLHEQTDEGWDAVLATNLTGVYLMCREAARRLVAADKPGNIVNITSGGGIRAGAGLAAYNASKAAVANLTRSMALDLVHHRISVNAIAPGVIRSEMYSEQVARSDAGRHMIANTPMGRSGDPAELDGALLLLASRRASSFITGIHLPVDGGMDAGQPGLFTAAAPS